MYKTKTIYNEKTSVFRVTKIGSMAVFFSDWCKDRGVDKKLFELSDMELD